MKFSIIISFAIVAVCFEMPDWINASNPVDALNQVSIDVFKSALKNEVGNFISSPFGILRLLKKIAVGSGGNTRKEFNEFLHMENLTDTSDLMMNWNKYLFNEKSNVYVNEKIKLKQSFKEPNINTVNFEDTEDAMNFIKSDIFENYDWEDNFAEADCVTKNTSLYLINIMNFKAGWLMRFKKRYTTLKPFNIDNSVKVDVDTMEIWDWFFVVNNTNIDAQIVELYYRINPIYKETSMFIIIPNKIEGLKNIEDNIDKINFTSLINPGYKNQMEEINLLLPKFKLQAHVDHIKLLKKMGINDAFTHDADFSGMSEDKNVMIDKIIQKITIDIHESGSSDSPINNNPVEYNKPTKNTRKVKVDRPFLVVIRIGNSIIFTGRVSDPSLN